MMLQSSIAIQTCIAVYLICISLISVIVTIADKRKAKKGAWRVPEATLLLLAALGGSVAMYLTMHRIHHKTKHLKFMLGIPMILLVQVLVVWGIVLR